MEKATPFPSSIARGPTPTSSEWAQHCSSPLRSPSSSSDSPSLLRASRCSIFFAQRRSVCTSSQIISPEGTQHDGRALSSSASPPSSIPVNPSSERCRDSSSSSLASSPCNGNREVLSGVLLPGYVSVLLFSRKLPTVSSFRPSASHGQPPHSAETGKTPFTSPLLAFLR